MINRIFKSDLDKYNLIGLKYLFGVDLPFNLRVYKEPITNTNIFSIEMQSKYLYLHDKHEDGVSRLYYTYNSFKEYKNFFNEILIFFGIYRNNLTILPYTKDKDEFVNDHIHCKMKNEPLEVSVYDTVNFEKNDMSGGKYIRIEFSYETADINFNGYRNKDLICLYTKDELIDFLNFIYTTIQIFKE